MTQHIQRYPFAPKAVWWKRYNDKTRLGNRTIYVANDSLGFEFSFCTFIKIKLINGHVEDNNVEYVHISENNLPTKALKFFEAFYIFNLEINNLDEHEVVEDDDLIYGLGENNANIIDVKPQITMKIEKNVYVRMFKFDCIKETDQQDSAYQQISGLITNSSYLTVKTHNFSNANAEPTHEDVLEYQNKFWFIEDTSKTYIYTPKEKSILHLSLKAINK